MYRDFLETVHGESFEQQDRWWDWLENVGTDATPLHLVQQCPSDAIPDFDHRDDILRAAFDHRLKEVNPEVHEVLLHRFGGVMGLYVHLLFTSNQELEKLYVMRSSPEGPEIVAERHVTDVLDALDQERGKNWWADEWLYPFLETIPQNVSQSARDGTRYPVDGREPKTSTAR
jgi:hypothetical protein